MVVNSPQNVSFHALIARAGSKEGARPLFQDLVALLVGAQHPTVRQVAARPGDFGIDAFVGELDQLTGIWQAKFFIDGVLDDQERQIRESLETVIAYASKEGLRIKSWTLCIPCSLDAPRQLWWAKFKRTNEKNYGIVIDLWDETGLKRRLISPDAFDVFNYFFGTGHYPERPLETLGDASAYDNALFIAQLRAAGHASFDGAKHEFYNAEILSREIQDKGVAGELSDLTGLRLTLYSSWELHFNDACGRSQTHEDALPNLYMDVKRAVQDDHRNGKRWKLPAGVVHKYGLVHQLVDYGRAGWTRRWTDVARAHGR